MLLTVFGHRGERSMGGNGDDKAVRGLWVLSFRFRRGKTWGESGSGSSRNAKRYCTLNTPYEIVFTVESSSVQCAVCSVHCTALNMAVEPSRDFDPSMRLQASQAKCHVQNTRRIAQASPQPPGVQESKAMGLLLDV